MERNFVKKWAVISSHLSYQNKLESCIDIYNTEEEAENVAGSISGMFVSAKVERVFVPLTDSDVSKIINDSRLEWYKDEIASRVRIESETPTDSIIDELASIADELYSQQRKRGDGFDFVGTQGEAIDAAVEDYCKEHGISDWDI